MSSLALIATTIAADGVRSLARSDCAAVHAARQAAENAVVVCPAADEIAVEYALALGFPLVNQLEPSQSAEFQVAYVGTGFADLVGDKFLGRWAEMSKASLLFDVIRCSCPTEIRDIECDAGRGARYLIAIRGPLILVLSNQAARPIYVSRYRRRSAAKQSSIHRSTVFEQLTDQAHTLDWNAVRPRVRTRRGQGEPSSADDRLNDAFSIRPGSRPESANVIVADPETCAQNLYRYLAHHSFVSRPKSDSQFEVLGARQISADPKTTDLVTSPVNMGSLENIMSRRPRQADDSPARHARQPRASDSVPRESHV